MRCTFVLGELSYGFIDSFKNERINYVNVYAFIISDKPDKIVSLKNFCENYLLKVFVPAAAL